AGFILVGGAVDPFAPSLVRATMGALFRQRFVRTGLPGLRHWLRRHRLCLVGATPDGDVDFDRIGYASTTLVALGEERAGLDDELRAICGRLVRIPMVSDVDSLNLGVAGSLMLYESRR